MSDPVTSLDIFPATFSVQPTVRQPLEGSSANSTIIDSFSSALKEKINPYGLGLSVVLDVPYAGGFITRIHNDPGDNVHVIQIEISMDTYMYEATTAASKRYALKKPRLVIVRNAVTSAFPCCLRGRRENLSVRKSKYLHFWLGIQSRLNYP